MVWHGLYSIFGMWIEQGRLYSSPKPRSGIWRQRWPIHGRWIGPAIYRYERFDLYALKTMEGALVALSAYEVREENLAVHIIYVESEPESNPTRTAVSKYRGVGQTMVAYGIQLSVDAGFNGDVTLNAKTPELARHYERDFGAFRVPGRATGCGTQISDL